MINKVWAIAILMVFSAVFSVSCAKSRVTGLTEEEAVELYNKAKEAYGWFDLTTIPHDSEKYVEVDGVKYFEVVQPGIISKSALTDYLNELFTEDITDNLMAASSERFVERDGKLYVLPADRGADIFKGDETYELSKLSDKQMKFTVTVEVYGDPDQKNVIDYEQYDFVLEFFYGRWIFQNFESVR